MNTIRTYKAFYKKSSWFCLKDNEGFDIEFLSLAATKTIIKEISTSYLYPDWDKHRWYITRSDGVKFDIFGNIIEASSASPISNPISE